jgi:hypothetical protein
MLGHPGPDGPIRTVLFADGTDSGEVTSVVVADCTV